ncbi:hypothetical protein HY949_02660 [Candidatus Gottesmanbacteria bacterium]|nr:hypothetical protein [Candidatus Gottesmanbacteria bacterium]
MSLSPDYSDYSDYSDGETETNLVVGDLLRRALIADPEIPLVLTPTERKYLEDRGIPPDQIATAIQQMTRTTVYVSGRD